MEKKSAQHVRCDVMQVIISCVDEMTRLDSPYDIRLAFVSYLPMPTPHLSY
jgi:hypothetical protein